MRRKQTIIQADNLTFRYDREVVLDSMSFTINRGDYVGILGPNGGGKSTLVKLILGIIRPDGGLMMLFDHHGNELKDKDRAKIAYVPQRSARTDLTFPATVFEIVRSGRTAHHSIFRHALTKHDKTAIRRAMRQTGITKLADRRISTLSGGQLQRVYLARALAAEPMLLVLDEPNAGVDQRTQQSFYALLGTLNSKHNLTIILVSHDVEVVTAHVNHILCVNKSLVCHGAPKKLLKEHFVDTLYGTDAKHVAHKH